MKTAHRGKSILEPIPSEHGEHMIMLSLQKKKRAYKERDIEHQLRSIETPGCSSDASLDDLKKELLDHRKKEFRTEFALNTHINCQGIFSPNHIMETQMPWVMDDENELILQNQYQPKISTNFNSELRSINHEIKVEKQIKAKIQKLQEKAGIKKRQTSIHSQRSADLSPGPQEILKTPKKKKKERGFISQLNLFDSENNENEYEFGSPSKQPLNQNIADPAYKPFKNDKSQESLYSGLSRKSYKSEDDSPHRRKLIRQSPSKKVKFVAKTSDVDRILNDSVELDSQLNSQLKRIKKVQKDTLDALSNSEGVFQQYNSAQKSFRDRLEVKKYEHLGNENFQRGLIQKNKLKNKTPTPLQDNVDKHDGIGKTSSFIEQSQPKKQNFLIRPKINNSSYKTLSFENEHQNLVPQQHPLKSKVAVSGKFINKKVLDKILQNEQKAANTSVDIPVDKIQLQKINVPSNKSTPRQLKRSTQIGDGLRPNPPNVNASRKSVIGGCSPELMPIQELTKKQLKYKNKLENIKKQLSEKDKTAKIDQEKQARKVSKGIKLMLKLSEEQKASLKSTRNLKSGAPPSASVKLPEKYLAKRGSLDTMQQMKERMIAKNSQKVNNKLHMNNDIIIQQSKIESLQRKKLVNYNFETTRRSSGMIVKQQKHNRFDSVDRSVQISGSILPKDGVESQVALYSTEQHTSQKKLSKEQVIQSQKGRARNCGDVSFKLKMSNDNGNSGLQSQSESRQPSRGTQRVLEICNQFKTLEPPSQCRQYELSRKYLSVAKNSDKQTLEKPRPSVSEFYSTNSKSQKFDRNISNQNSSALELICNQILNPQILQQSNMNKSIDEIKESSLRNQLDKFNQSYCTLNEFTSNPHIQKYNCLRSLQPKQNQTKSRYIPSTLGCQSVAQNQNIDEQKLRIKNLVYQGSQNLSSSSILKLGRSASQLNQINLNLCTDGKSSPPRLNLARSIPQKYPMIRQQAKLLQGTLTLKKHPEFKRTQKVEEPICFVQGNQISTPRRCSK